MTYAVFGRPSEKTLAMLQVLIDYCVAKNHTLLINKLLVEGHEEEYKDFYIFEKTHEFSCVDLGISIGGDGTFIRMSRILAPYKVPVLGSNTGRLGFLAEVANNELITTLENFEKKDYEQEEVTMLELEIDVEGSTKNTFWGVNEVSVLRRDTSSLLVVKVYANGKFINNYWADGLIVATPTGSTAYSMACGGPIVAPQSKNLVITPISPHSLTVRPLIINDDVELSIEVESRADTFLVSLDSRSKVVNIDKKLKVRTSPHKLKVVKPKGHDYFATLREKLMWGQDKREV